MTARGRDSGVTTAPIALFVFNRPEHTRRTVESLQANRGAGQSDLIVYCDGPRTEAQWPAVQEVRAYLRTIGGFNSVSVIERETNMGLAASIIAGVSEVLARSGSVVVMEDDLVSSPNYLAFVNEALRVYRDRPDVFSVTGYNYPMAVRDDYPFDAYLSYRGSSWGWGTWADRWSRVDWTIQDFEKLQNSPSRQALFARGGADLYPMLAAQQQGLIDSWSIRFCYAMCVNNAFCLHPIHSKIQNIGFDASGVHCEASDKFWVELDDGERPFALPPDLALDPEILQIVAERFRPSRPISLMQRMRRLIAEMGQAPARALSRTPRR